MATNSRTIRVTGLPVDVPENRLTDKILIHFLRKKNGGGDIRLVSVSKTTPGSAFITFEEPEVALRLVRRGNQVFKVNDRSYDVSVSLQQEGVDPDEILLEMSVMVDLSKLPDGRQTLLSLQKKFPGVHLIFDQQKELCTMRGLYSEVQALSGMMLGSLPTQKQTKVNGPSPNPKKKEKQNLPLETSAKSKHAPASGDWDQPLESWKSGLAQSQSYSHQASHDVLKQDEWDLTPNPGAPFEDFSLIVDSDIFRYLYKYCAKEYESILVQNGVEVVEVNCGDIMTLYFKLNRVEHGMSSVKKAHQDLALLYQEKESQLRKEQVSKSKIPKKYLEHALESLKERLPMLMLDEDAENVYMVGGKRDVSEAKQFIVEVKGAGMDFSDPFASGDSTIRFSKQESSVASEQTDIFRERWKKSDDSEDLFKPKMNLQKTKRRNTSGEPKSFGDQPSTGLIIFPAETKEKPLEDIFVRRQDEISDDLKGMECDAMDKYGTHSHFTHLKTSSPVVDPDEKLLEKSGFLSEKESGSKKQTSTTGYKTKPAEPGRERTMAANFSSGPKDLHYSKIAQEPKSAPEIKDIGQPGSQPLIKPSVNSNLTPNTSHGSVSSNPSSSRLDVQVLKSDMNRHISSIPTENIPAGHSAESQTFSLGHMDTGEALGIRMNPSMPLRRSSSFSGRNKPCKDHQVDSGRGSVTYKVYKMDLAVPCTLWLYLRSVYKAKIENLTSDLQLKEQYNNAEIKLCLSGTDWEKLNECHYGLKSLIDKVSLDFDTKTLLLSDFGVSDSKDQTLADFCTVMKQSYGMVNIIIMPNNIMVLGPKLLCEMVEATLMEVFHTSGTAESKKSPYSAHSDTVTIQQDTSSVLDQTGAHPSIPLLTDQTADTRFHIMNKEQGNQSSCQNEKEPFLQPDLGEGSTRGCEKVMKSASENKADVKPDGETSIATTLHVQSDSQNKATVNDQVNPSTVDQTRAFSGSHEVQLPSLHLPSKASGAQELLLCHGCQRAFNTVKQRCGFNFCPRCEKEVHTTCKTCLQYPSKGIRGTMKIRELAVTIPGFQRDTTLKIIYDVPDGIQGDDHPCPGEPFKGRSFEAFLPNNEATKKLLPLLEKAFHKGFTFTVKACSSEEGRQEGTVVWSRIPHKTRIDGGYIRNGYPDFSYIKRLTEALKAAEVEQ